MISHLGLYETGADAPGSGAAGEIFTFAPPPEQPPPGSGPSSGYTPPGSFLPGFFSRPTVENPLPPNGCVLARALVPQALSADYIIDDPEALLMQMPLSTQAQFARARAGWTSAYPHAPAPILIVGSQSNDPTRPVYQLTLSRPMTDYDPALDAYPVLVAGTKETDVFEAGLRLFFPDWILNPQTGANLRSGHQGSMTVDGPFPYWVKFVNEAMVSYAVGLINTTPDLFKPPGDTSHWDFDFQRSLKAGVIGLQLGKAAGPYAPLVGLAAAAGSLIVDAFAGLFSWLGDDNPPPAWLTKLIVMKQLRQDTSGTLVNGPPSFGKQFLQGGSFLHNPYGCRLAIIHPPSDGAYTVQEGYLEVVKRVREGKGGLHGLKLWILIGLGVGLGYYALS